MTTMAGVSDSGTGTPPRLRSKRQMRIAVSTRKPSARFAMGKTACPPMRIQARAPATAISRPTSRTSCGK